VIKVEKYHVEEIWHGICLSIIIFNYLIKNKKMESINVTIVVNNQKLTLTDKVMFDDSTGESTVYFCLTPKGKTKCLFLMSDADCDGVHLSYKVNNEGENDFEHYKPCLTSGYIGDTVYKVLFSYIQAVDNKKEEDKMRNAFLFSSCRNY
jgi:hypothetical protein